MNANCTHYDFEKIESFWQDFWEENKIFCVKEDETKPKYYVLDMFPYPSGAGLHIGHPEGYTASDILARYKRAKGFNVLHPMGWDAFGLPAEQHAINTGIPPEINTAKNIEIFKRQIKRIGFAIDWDREINTTDPKYFKWTQWIFLQLFKHGLAYVDERPVWWCEDLKAVLANEEVINGRSERGNFPVKRRNLRQWVLRITKYADELLNGLENIDWPDSTKNQQISWIGLSDGANIKFSIDGYSPDGHAEEIEVYTTRPDTIFGTTYLAIAPEHPIIEKIVTKNFKNEVQQYIELSRTKSDLDRTDLAKEKTGVFTGAYAINPVNEEKIPIWVADYILISYGSGAIMAVPAHDKRDYEFAKQYKLRILPVISESNDPSKIDEDMMPYLGEGVLVNSKQFDGLKSADAKKVITEFLQRKNHGEFAKNYKLRDWLFSRQRYWGEPIPIIWVSEADYINALKNENFYFSEFIPSEPVKFKKDEVWYCALPLTSKHLPLLLPPTDNYLPSSDGESPLSNISDWMNVFVNIKTGDIVSSEKFADTDVTNSDWVCGRRETNTMPQWAGSCWYHLRYMSPNCENELVDSSAAKYWGAPDFYIGGAEHAVLHLLYARFWHMFLYDIGVIHTTREPYIKLFHQGIILGEDGTKMSKSRGNVINPDKIISKYGADALRMYEMFLGPLDMIKPWNTNGIEGISRFLKKVWNEFVDGDGNIKISKSPIEEDLQKSINETIEKVGSDIEHLKFNTAISQMMICLNCAQKNYGFDKISAEKFIKLLSPFAPHISEEIWARLGNFGSIVDAGWPEVDKSKIISDSFKIVVQINGKVRSDITLINGEDSDDKIFQKILQDNNIQKFILGKNILKKIYVKGKVFNIVVD